MEHSFADTSMAFARPLYVMAKPAGAHCNMRCRYCYYMEKKILDKSTGYMSDGTLREFVRQFLESQTAPEVLFTWHGGEPLLRPLDFYHKAMAWQRAYAGGRHVDNCIQTNGTLLTDDWCRFLHDHHWLVGLSIDGPVTLHDPFRHMADGSGSYSRVMRAVEMLNRHEVEWNAMAVVNAKTARHPLEFYRFFRDLDCHFLQFTPIVERIHRHSDGRMLAAADETGEGMTDESVTPADWGEFLCQLFDEWVRKDVGDLFVQIFDATLANWCGVAPGVCSLARYCGQAGVVEANGDVYSCDHFVFPQYRLGNIHSQTITEMMYGERQQRFGLSKFDSLPHQCRACRFLFACHGECPKNRFLMTADGEPGLNYLCEGYHRFFSHVAPYMDFMRGEWEAGRAPANVMAAVADGRL